MFSLLSHSVRPWLAPCKGFALLLVLGGMGFALTSPHGYYSNMPMRGSCRSRLFPTKSTGHLPLRMPWWAKLANVLHPCGEEGQNLLLTSFEIFETPLNHLENPRTLLRKLQKTLSTETSIWKNVFFAATCSLDLVSPSSKSMSGWPPPASKRLCFVWNVGLKTLWEWKQMAVGQKRVPRWSCKMSARLVPKRTFWYLLVKGKGKIDQNLWTCMGLLTHSQIMHTFKTFEWIADYPVSHVSSWCLGSNFLHLHPNISRRVVAPWNFSKNQLWLLRSEPKAKEQSSKSHATSPW